MNALALLLAAALGAEVEASAVRVSPGAQKVLQIPGLERVAIADPGVADVTLTGDRELLVLGRKQGQTSLTLWIDGHPTTRTIIVDDGRLAALATLIKERVNPSLQCEVVAGKLVVDGLLDSVEEYGRLKSIAADNPEVKLLARLDPRVLPAVAQAITDAMQKHGLKNARAVVYGQRIVLEGAVADEEEKQRAQLIADSLYKDLLDVP
ncbi:MAG: pilus assembly protein N-terminal domain-containing protein [Myxococcales bacterium]|jgi:hypothetical protein